MPNWTAPQPGGVYPSQANYNVHPAEIGQLVAAIMQSKARAQQQQAQEMQQLMSGIGQGISGAYNAYNQSQVADYLNLQSQARAANTPGGVSQAMLEAQQGMTPQARIATNQLDLQNQMYSQLQNPTFARAPDGTMMYQTAHGWHPVSGRGTGQETIGQTNTALRAQADAAEQALQDQYDMSPGETKKAVPGDFDAQGNFVPNEQGQYVMFGPQRARTIPGSQGYTDPLFGHKWTSDQPAHPDTSQGPPDYSNVYPRQEASAIKALADQYYSLLQQQRVSGGSTGGGYGAGLTPGGNIAPAEAFGGGQSRAAQIKAIQDAYNASAKTPADYEKAAAALRALGVQ